MRLVCPAPAKINLALHVGPPRADGLHPLESLAAFADVGDLLAAEPAEQLSLAVVGPFGAALEADPVENLALRAARALAEAAGAGARGARIVLEKRLPIASGVGGGSADAAATLRLLNRLWDVRASEEDLSGLAARLGADVPVCVACRPALMRGAGEICSPAALPTLHAVLVNPGAPAPTGLVYRQFDAMGGGGAFRAGEIGAGFADADAAIAALSGYRNDLEAAAIAVAPAIARALDLLGRSGRVRLARMSGSGATVFALVEDARAAAALAAEIAGAQPGWWVRATRLGAIDATPQPG